jgi:hypothetical protein
LLSTDSPTKDEDPKVIRARDGSLFVAWFSDRGGNADIYLAHTSDGAAWSAPIRVTSSPAGDFYPSLFQDNKGTFHLVWFRWTALFSGHIWYNTSPDGLTWSQNAERQVTFGTDVDDWAPTLTEAPNGTLLVYFVSTKRAATRRTADIYVAARRPGNVQWD